MKKLIALLALVPTIAKVIYLDDGSYYTCPAEDFRKVE